MRKLPVLVAALTVVAVTLSSGASYAAIAHQLQVQRTDSAEILKVHARTQATMDEALNQPDLPPFVASVTTSEAGTTFVVSIRSR